MNTIKKIKKEKGFTLIETMVGIGIFLIVVTLGTGSLLNAYSVNKKSQNFRSILDGLSFAMEDMSRNIRTGYNYSCFKKGEDVYPEQLIIAKSCGYGYGLAFESSQGDEANKDDQWSYYIFGGKLFKATTSDLKYPIQMTSSEIVLDSTKSNFFILGAEANNEAGGFNKQQPMVTINLVGEIVDKNVRTPFFLQTSISQRISDI